MHDIKKLLKSCSGIMTACVISVSLTGCSDRVESDSSTEKSQSAVSARQTASTGAGDQIGGAGERAAKGKRLFLQCRACHAVTPDAPGNVGPNLYGVFGKEAGADKGFGYSTAMTEMDSRWTEKNLDSFLENPSAHVPGTSMAFAGIASSDQRSDIIEYLKSLDID